MLTPAEHQKFREYVGTIDVKRLARAFDALGEPNRCTIFRALLKHDNVSVGQLASSMKLSEPLTSQHLKVLLNANLVSRKKIGRNVYYVVDKSDKLVGALAKTTEV